MLEGILKEQNERCGPNSYGSGLEQKAGCCEQGNEPSGSKMWGIS